MQMTHVEAFTRRLWATAVAEFKKDGGCLVNITDIPIIAAGQLLDLLLKLTVILLMVLGQHEMVQHQGQKLVSPFYEAAVLLHHVLRWGRDKFLEKALAVTPKGRVH